MSKAAKYVRQSAPEQSHYLNVTLAPEQESYYSAGDVLKLHYTPIDIEYIVLVNYIGQRVVLGEIREEWNIINISRREETVISLLPGEDEIIYEIPDNP